MNPEKLLRAFMLAYIMYKIDLDEHRHRCDVCGLVWEHDGNAGGLDWAHRCPECGIEQYNRYHGNQPAVRFLGPGKDHD